jgi:hypothetical protein
VGRYNRFGLRASAEIARKYADAPAIGFMAGKRNRITIGDVDEVGEKPLQRFLDRHGPSPVIARTTSGKHHVWYRHNARDAIVSVRSARGFRSKRLNDLVTDRDTFALLGFLRAYNGPEATFMVANGLTERLKMSLPRLQRARKQLTGPHIRLVRPDTT